MRWRVLLEDIDRYSGTQRLRVSEVNGGNQFECPDAGCYVKDRWVWSRIAGDAFGGLPRTECSEVAGL